jgi:hypothetical protein
MIDFSLSVKLKIGGETFEDGSKRSIFSRFKFWLSDKYLTFVEFLEYLKNDTSENYRITFDEGYDAYMILYDNSFSEGFYARANEPGDWFYKSHDEDGNPIAAFVVPDVYVENTIQRMEGLQITPTDRLQSMSVAEIYITNCDEANIDPYIQLRNSYLPDGTGIVWYGRRSKYEIDQSYFDQFNAEFALEVENVTEWINNHPDPEPDPIDLMIIQRREEMQNAIDKQNSRRRRRVQSTRN